MIVANFIPDSTNPHDRFVVELVGDDAVIEHRFMEGVKPKAKELERGPVCDTLLSFADLICEQTYAKMPCPGCDECSGLDDDDEFDDDDENDLGDDELIFVDDDDDALAAADAISEGSPVTPAP